MEKLTWFKFTISDWMMGKIMKCPEVTQARFLRLCCLYWNKECVLSLDDAEIEIDEDHIKVLLSKKVIVLSDEKISIKFLDEQWSDVLDTSELRRLAVKKRWEKAKNTNTSVSNNHTSVSISDTSVIQSDTDKSRVRVEESKSREDKNHKEVIKKTVSQKKPTNLTDFKDIARLSFENNKCLFGIEFKKLWFILIQEKKWRIKSQSAIDLSLKKAMKYEESFASELVQAAISGNYQGLEFSDTKEHYKKYLSEKNGTTIKQSPGTRSNHNSTGKKDFGKL